MTPDVMIETFENLVDDSLDEMTEYMLANDVKDALEADDEWAILKGLDETATANAGDGYKTFHTLPTDFGLPSQKGVYVGDDIIPWRQVPFEQVQRYKDIAHTYYIDMANNRYALCGTQNPGGTIHFFYQKSSPALVKGGAAWIFPARFHPIIPQLMAEMFPSIDQPDKSRAWDDRWNVHASKRLEIMRRWNARLQLQGHQNDEMPIDISAQPNMIDIDAGSSGGSMIYG